MKKTVVVMVAFCLFGVALFAQTEDVLSLEDAIALYEDDRTKIGEGYLVIELLKELVPKGINATNPDTDPYPYPGGHQNNNTPLIYASMGGYTEVVKSLIASGANVNAENDISSTALIEAAFRGEPEVVKVLIAAGANLDAKNDYGNTALIWAAWKGHIEVVKVLIAAGADIDVENDDDKTALMKAAEMKAVGGGYPDIVNLLKDAGGGKRAIESIEDLASKGINATKIGKNGEK